MNNIDFNPVNYCTCICQSQEKNLVKSLPSEIFIKILSNLDKIEMKESRLVSRHWNVFLVDIAVHHELLNIKKYGKFLCENLNVSRKLFTIESENKILNSTDLGQLKSSVLETKESFIIELKNFNEDELKKIFSLSGNETKPKCFENILQLALINKSLSEVDLLPDEEKERALYGASFSLTLLGEIDKALDVAKRMPGSFTKTLGLQEIFSICIESDQLDKAFEVAHMMMDGRWRHKEQALFEVFCACTLSSKFEKALECILSLPEDFCPYKDHIMFNLNNGNIDKILEFVSFIPHKGVKALCLTTIHDWLTRKAKEVAKLINNKELK